MKLIQSFSMGKERKGRGKKHLGKEEINCKFISGGLNENREIYRKHLCLYLHYKERHFPPIKIQFNEFDECSDVRRFQQVSHLSRVKLCDTHIVQFFLV